MSDAIDRDVARRLERLRQEDGELIRIDRIADVVREILADVKSLKGLRLYRELESLADYIRGIKAEIASMRPDEIQDHYLPSATDELDAIIEATESATNDILAAAETIESVAAELGGDQADRLTEATTAVYEACTFQDITGQRISKVVKALKVVEERVAHLATAFGAEIEALSRGGDNAVDAAPPVVQDAETPPGDTGPAPGDTGSAPGDTPGNKAGAPGTAEAHLLNGPELGLDAPTRQSEIDALFASD